ncbi:MAG: hypothetical protein GX322_03440 [Firmicutes bacterium]|nr:hypothetical protein [Bacillota bacterium]
MANDASLDQLDDIKLLIPLNERYLTIPRLVLSDVFGKVGLDVCDTTSYKVALTEAGRYLIYFSYRHLEPHPLQATFRIAPQEITIGMGVRGKCYCDTRIKAHPRLSQQEATGSLDLLLVASLVDGIRNGIRREGEDCTAFIEMTKFLHRPSPPCR